MIPHATATVLWIDDDQLLLSMGIEALQEGGYRVITAPDGATGIAVAKRERPDLILLDLIMPSMHGLEVCQQLRADPDFHATPIVLLTALPDSEVATMGPRVGATLTLRKPFGMAALLQTLAELLPRPALP
jgi:DNA-binding response OmpR family regulator